MVNWIGVKGSVKALINPKIIIPRLIISDISHLNWELLKYHGVTGIVIDKDNCITKPGQDTLVPSLNPAWEKLLTTFGAANVLVVSNSAGTNKDSLLLQAESVSRNLKVPVLVHPTFKPGKECALSTARYFSPSPSSSSTTPSPLLIFLRRKLRIKSKPPLGAVIWTNKNRSLELYPTPPRLLPSSNSNSTSISTDSDPSSFDSSLSSSSPHQILVVIGDRLATDMILSYQLSNLSPSTKNLATIRAIPVLTTNLHASESLGTTFLRGLEKGLLRLMKNKKSTLIFQSEGPWNQCLLPIIPSPSLSPLPSSFSSSPKALKIPLLIKILHPLVNLSHQITNSINYQSEWNWTKKTNEVYKAPGGLEFWAEKLIDRTEEVMEGKKRKVKQVLKRVGIRE